MSNSISHRYVKEVIIALMLAAIVLSAQLEDEMQYVSDELFHFVGRHEPTPDKQFELLVTILRNGTLLSSRHSKSASGTASEEKMISGELTKIPAICFCDIPRPSLRIHIQKYSKFGLSFTKRFLSSRGAKPVIYVPLKSRTTKGVGVRGVEIPKTLREVINSLKQLQGSKSKASSTLASQYEFLTNEFYYFIKMFDEDLSQDNSKNYYMEREWRLVTGSTRTQLNFSLEDVHAVMVPRRFRQRLLNEFRSLSNRVVNVPK